MKRIKSIKGDIIKLIVLIISGAAIAAGFYYYYGYGYKQEWLLIATYVGFALFIERAAMWILYNPKTNKEVKKMQTHYKVGQTICLMKVLGEPDYNWAIGTITRIDETGKLYGTWGDVAVDPSVDDISVVNK